MDRDRCSGGEGTVRVSGDPADYFVTEHERFPQCKRTDRAVLVVVQVRAADTAMGVADQDLTVVGCGFDQVVEP